ncbi:MAG: hypothetical protein QOJ29_4727 [Thermoleophilaceae bacterium]|jgi:acyl-coenzyme A synthetase/AMP-(fatty) acid ligase|nr:hypothetical protein [Thermoleophilaceae bacterium]
MTAVSTVPAFAERVLEHARLRPAAPALMWRGRHVDYAELADLVLDARLQLRSLGGQGPIGLLARKSPQAIALILACLLERRPVFVPSPDLAADTLERLFARAGCGHVLRPGEDAAPAPAPRTRAVGGPDAALMLTTSGSTGTPKIVPLSGRAIDHFTAWAGHRFAITREAAVLSYAPLNFDLCLLDIWTTLSHGGTVVLVEHDRATDAHHLLELIAVGQVQLVQGVPMLYRLLSDAARKQGCRLDGVRHVIVTGDSIAPTALTALAELFPDARLHNVYGCTETNDSFAAEIDVRAAVARGEVTLGTPLPGVSALIVAASEDVIDGPGEGELWVATPFQTDGYLDASLNSGKFEPHPQGLDGRTYFRTGDIVCRREDGSITLRGRNDNLVKVRGVRVSTQAVEQALLEHEAVVEVAVVAVADGLSGSRLRAVVRRDDASRLDSLILRRHCAGRLEPAAIPSTIDIVTYPLPKTTTGKVDRRRSIPNEPRRSVA